MKKLLLLLLFMSCASIPEVKETPINTPEWIRGTWVMKPETSLTNFGAVFNRTEVLIIDSSPFRSSLEMISGEIATDKRSTNRYDLYVLYATGAKKIHQFTLISKDSLRYGKNIILTREK